MAYKRVLTIQDISCVGQCSMTVALPVLSVCGMETCVLPTEILSTHTGGFQKPVIRHLTDSMDEIRRHWERESLRFDAIYTGYLGSCQAVDGALEVTEALLDPEGVLIVDPVMGDHGKLYSGFDQNYVQAISGLCARADILLPNLTEAALLTGLPYREDKDLSYARRLGELIPGKTVILTGVGAKEGQTGVLFRWEKGWQHFCQPEIEGRYSGTGDLFASCFTGAYLQGKSIPEAVQIAAETTAMCIRNTREHPVHPYGIQFETVLGELIRRVKPV